MIEGFYKNNGHIDMEGFKKIYLGKEIYGKTLAAIGAATGSMEFIKYAQEHKGGRLNMCTALENLKQEGENAGILKGMIAAYRELNISDEMIIQKLQEKGKLSPKEAQDYLKQN